MWRKDHPSVARAWRRGGSAAAVIGKSTGAALLRAAPVSG
ncbi:hypothetical protein SLNWT_1720 [Streptomyces albus]|uniref:Uncharacterized protein n=1 Tax=Streptomyces albus (strain ATCC 21838 / DSM 41398 / FERM P-419 / JCM 4703 / NBRC 107858) TaxID=1081613 RepID=A0A0B5ETN8_STRA4|nr:hypothetical protein SLNWT_1720 [Streptomyces albus]AOU76413.1 hypothetical protein SLNHY_1722 [Streptomyces albus]AYN32199.1 hypothetical protein DUI70_1696 [Streptomyces albus]